jgi:hypothetical protein
MKLPGRTLTVLAAILLGAACGDTAPTEVEDQSSLSAATAELNSGSAASYSGRATVVIASSQTLGLDTRVADTGPVPPEGGDMRQTVVNASIPGLMSATELHARAVAHRTVSWSLANAFNLTLTPGGNTITAEKLRAHAEASCQNGSEEGTGGGSQITRLRINGEPVTITGEQNQRVPLAVGEVVINEQSRASDNISVIALYVIIPGVADLAVSAANAGIACGA